MGCGFSNSAPVVKFNNGVPTFKGDEVVKCFEDANGVVYRIVNKKTGQWALYNDSAAFQAAVEVTFSADSVISALGSTQVQDAPTSEKLASVVVQPLGTEMFVEGHVGTFKLQCDLLPVETAAPAGAPEEEHAVSGEEAPAAENAAVGEEEEPPAELEEDQTGAAEDEQPAAAEEGQPAPVDEQPEDVEEEQPAE